MSSLEILQQDVRHGIDLISYNEEALRQVQAVLLQILPSVKAATPAVKPTKEDANNYQAKWKAALEHKREMGRKGIETLKKIDPTLKDLPDSEFEVW